MESLAGLFAPIVTPFTDEGSTVSEVRLSRQMRFLIERGVAGFVTSTDTGEFLATTSSERKQVLELTIRESQGRPTLAHVSAMNTSMSLDIAQHAARHGARAAIAMAPYYGRYTDEEVSRYFETLAAYANIPIIIVDPLERLNDAIRQRLATIGAIHFANPLPQPEPHPSFSDSFQIGKVIVSPIVVLSAHGEAAGIDRVLAEYGGKRIVKAGFEAMGIDMGTPRAPAAPPPLAAVAQLKAYLGLTD